MSRQPPMLHRDEKQSPQRVCDRVTRVPESNEDRSTAAAEIRRERKFRESFAQIVEAVLQRLLLRGCHQFHLQGCSAGVEVLRVEERRL